MTATHHHFQEHPASRAWRRATGQRVQVTGIEVLKGKRVSTVVRLFGLGPGGSAVVAKRAPNPTGRVERTIYERLLPHLPLSAPRYFGFAQEDADFCWLFLEDVGREVFSPANARHRAAAARWLATLHITAADFIAAADLPDRGPDHYLRHLQIALSRILTNLGNPDLTNEDVRLLKSIASLCRDIESQWAAITQFCGLWPRTLVHGDFRPKNVRIRLRSDGVGIFPLDWETAGWGIPAADLAPNRRYMMSEQVHLATYRRYVARRWPQLGDSVIRQLSAVGHLFRLLASIAWSSEILPYSNPVKALAQLRIYYSELLQVFEERRWAS